jgi:hypothetical protein
MRLGQEIEQVRIAQGIPVCAMCDILAINTEKDYHDIVTGRTKPDVYQMIMLIICTRHGFVSPNIN